MARPYDSIPDRRDIIHRRALAESLEKLVEDRGTRCQLEMPPMVRHELVAGLGFHCRPELVE